MSLSHRTRATVAATALVVAACQPGINTGGFGQNVVRYDDFDFKILETEHFDIYYYDEELDAARQAGRMAERWYTRLSQLLNHELRGRQVIVYYASHPHFKQTTTITGQLGEGTQAVTEALKRRVVLPFAGPLQETDHVLGHEMVHAFQFDMTSRERRLSSSNFPRALVLPLWFIEGMAEYLALGSNDPHTTMWIRDAAVNDRLPTMAQLNSPRYFPYRFGQAFWAYVAGRFGDQSVGRILNAAARTGSAEAALSNVLGIPVDSLNAEWHDDIRTAFDRVRELTNDADVYGAPIFSRESGGRLNTGPALSPDGTRIVYLAVRDVFSLDMFLADAKTGVVLDKLVESASDPHFESIQFFKSAGAWDASGTRFAFAAITESDPLVRIVDIESGEMANERVFPELGEIMNPSWSPDGRAIAFSAMSGGYADLYVYDIARDSLRRLTDDPYADLQPVWGPEGDRLAFVTDRFGTELASLTYGNYRLATYHLETGAVDSLPSFPNAKNVNPQWGASGTDLYFLGNPNGVTNVYRLDLRTNQIFRITNLFTGVSGITALSPALSAAAGVNKIAFSVYERGEYNIYTVDAPEVLAGTLVTTPVLGRRR